MGRGEKKEWNILKKGKTARDNNNNRCWKKESEFKINKPPKLTCWWIWWFRGEMESKTKETKNKEFLKLNVLSVCILSGQGGVKWIVFSVYLLAGYVKVKGGLDYYLSRFLSPLRVLVPDVVAHRRNALPALVRGGKNASGACPECVRCSNGWRRQPTGAAPCSRNCETFLHWSSTSSSCSHQHKSSPDWNRKIKWNFVCFLPEWSLY